MTSGDPQPWRDPVNSLCAKVFSGNINIYLHFMSFLDTEHAWEIQSFVKEGPIYPIGMVNTMANDDPAT